MSTPLRTLIVDDSEDDALLISHALKKGGFQVETCRVETEEQMRSALDERPWDLVISDFRMPAFDTYRALDLLRECKLNTPCVVVSGVIPMENALAFVKAGARDFIEKGDLDRLVPVVYREIASAPTVGRTDEHDLDALREALEFVGDPFMVIDPQGDVPRIEFVNKALAGLAGHQPEVFAAQPLSTLFCEQNLVERLQKFFSGDSSGTEIVAAGRHPEFGIYHAHWHVRPFRDGRYWLMVNRGGYSPAAQLAS